MRLIHLIAPQQPTKQRPSGIDDEHPQQNQPAPQQLWRHPGRLQREHAQRNTEKATTGITHEDARWREVPEQETRYRYRQRQRRQCGSPLT
ncbi:hypothetical protein D9M69_670290 [compost metagenome]